MVNVLQRALAKVIRITGQSLDTIGKSIDPFPYTERLQPSLRAVKLRNAAPKSSGTFVAPSATLIGKVQVGKFSSVWYGATLRADVSSITVGEHTTIGDRVMVHCSSQPKEFPTKIGNNVVVEAGCILHGCEIQDGSYIGEGTQVLDGARVEKNAAVAAGSLVSLGKVVPTGQLWGGVPAIFQRNLTEDEIAAIRAASIENAELSVFHTVETSKNWEEIEHDEYEWDQTMYRPADAKVRPQSDADKRKYTGPGSILNTDCKSSSLFLSCSWLSYLLLQWWRSIRQYSPTTHKPLLQSLYKLSRSVGHFSRQCLYQVSQDKGGQSTFPIQTNSKTNLLLPTPTHTNTRPLIQL